GTYAVAGVLYVRKNPWRTVSRFEVSVRHIIVECSLVVVIPQCCSAYPCADISDLRVFSTQASYFDGTSGVSPAFFNARKEIIHMIPVILMVRRSFFYCYFFTIRIYFPAFPVCHQCSIGSIKKNPIVFTVRPRFWSGMTFPRHGEMIKSVNYMLCIKRLMCAFGI